jgi:hypothetical protein
MNERERKREKGYIHRSAWWWSSGPCDGVGDEGDAVWRCFDGQWTSRRGQCRPLDRLGFGVGWRLGQPRVLSPCPHSLLYGTVRRGPTNPVGLDAPDQGGDQGPSRPLGLTRRKSILTFSPLISSYTLTLNFDFNCFHFYLFHHKLVYRACLIITVSRR